MDRLDLGRGKIRGQELDIIYKPVKAAAIRAAHMEIMGLVADLCRTFKAGDLADGIAIKIEDRLARTAVKCERNLVPLGVVNCGIGVDPLCSLVRGHRDTEHVVLDLNDEGIGECDQLAFIRDVVFAEVGHDRVGFVVVHIRVGLVLHIALVTELDDFGALIRDDRGGFGNDLVGRGGLIAIAALEVGGNRVCVRAAAIIARFGGRARRAGATGCGGPAAAGVCSRQIVVTRLADARANTVLDDNAVWQSGQIAERCIGTRHSIHKQITVVVRTVRICILNDQIARTLPVCTCNCMDDVVFDRRTCHVRADMDLW